MLSFSQENYKIVIGKVIDEEQQNPIPYVHVRNLTDNYGTITDSLGVFKLKLISDSSEIKVSAIGYYSRIIEINKDSFDMPFEILLKYRIYEIMQVDIYPFTKKEFKHEFIYGNIKKDDIDIIKDNMRTKFNSVKRLKELTPKLQIPINYKTSIQRQEELIAKIKEFSALKTKNYKRIRLITKLKEKEVYEFDKFCRFSFHFLKNASEYVIHREIHKYWKEYKKIKYLDSFE